MNVDNDVSSALKVELALQLADELCTAVISGRSGQVRLALSVVHVLNEIK